jgi:hypothetical protein
MKRPDTRGHSATFLLLCAAIAGGLNVNAALAATTGSPAPGQTWASIAKLPDWSGAWALTREGHEYATKEAHSVSPTGAVSLMPFTPKAAQMLLEAQRTDQSVNLARCLPAGIPGVMLHTIMLQWLFTPGAVTMLTENGEVRRFHTDGRAHRRVGDVDGSYEGDSTAHWEGTTLVADTVDFPNGTLLKDGYLMATKNTRYQERIFLKDKDHLQIDSVLSDPAIFTKPFTASRIYQRLADTELGEPQCAQGQRDDGITLDLTPPAE